MNAFGPMKVTERLTAWHTGALSALDPHSAFTARRVQRIPLTVAVVSHSHVEPFLHLVDVTSDRALVAWGGFFFERGGKVREEPPSDFAAAGAVAWATQAHCLLVEITGDRLAITPVAAVGSDGELEVMTALSPRAQVVPPPFVVTAR